MTTPDGRRPPVLRDSSGHALLMVLVLIVAATMVVTSLVILTVSEERAAAAAGSRAALVRAADAVVAEMQERLVARVQRSSGALWTPDIAILNAEVTGDVEVPPGVRIDFARTGFRVIEQRENETIPHDAAVVAAFSDQPRLGYDGIPPVGGLVAARTLVVSVYVTVRPASGRGSYTLRRDLAVSQVPPHQHALYAAGEAAPCAYGGDAWIGGPVRVDGTLTAPACSGLVRYTGGIEARDGLSVLGAGSHYVVGSDGQTQVASVSREDATADAAGWLSRWGGRVRVGAALGGPLAITRLSTWTAAGIGECEDFADPGGLVCSGRARYYPAVQVQRMTRGAGGEYAVRCGPAYEDDGCPELGGAIAYVPWPFAAEMPAGAAADVPGTPGRLWRGLLPDSEREIRCTGTVAGNVFRTARCPTNAYGFTIDVGALPAIEGGVLSVRRAANAADGSNDSGLQEIVLLTNATALAGPLTIHSEIPVYIAGSFNTRFTAAYNGPPPASIQAPRIVVLPNEALGQLQTSMVWDSVPPAGSSTPTALPLHAESNVTLYAVLRTSFCAGSGVSSTGVVAASPAVLGDWRAASLRVVGAVELSQAGAASAACTVYSRAPGALPPSGTSTVQPASRMILYDDRLLHPQFQPYGSWTYGNVPAGGAAAIPGRPPARQLRTTGGTAIVRRLAGDLRGAPAIPPALPIQTPGAFPAAPLPLP